MKMGTTLLTALSFVLTGVVIGNAYYQKKQFYPSVVYITKSSPSMAMLYLQAFVLVIITGKIMRKIFFGQLRAAELEHLIERSWYAVTETCLAFTVFRDDFSPKFVALFTLLLFLKCFHWLAEDRIDYMERSPVISILFHLRALSLITLLTVLDVYFITTAYHSTLTKGASVQLVFGFEYAILLTAVWMTLMKYGLHSIDLQNENPWENKAVYLLYTELVIGAIKVVLYLLFMVIMIKVHTFPLFAIRPMYLSMRAFKKSLHDVIMSRRAIQNMNTLYPDVTQEELQSGDNVCIICREEMTSSAKKLPCNHTFHTSCLRSWFQRQQTCPTCRLDVLRMPREQTTQGQNQQGQTQQNQQQQQQQQPVGAQNQMPNIFPGFPGMPPVWPNMAPPQQPTSSGPSAAGTEAQTSQTSASAGISASSPAAASMPTLPGMPGSPLPPFMGMPPFMMPPFGYAMPRPHTDMSSLSEEELKAMEGQERENIENRILWLRDIQALLDGAMVLINQYNSIAAQTGISSINVNRSTGLSQSKSSEERSSEQKSTYSSSKMGQATNTTDSKSDFRGTSVYTSLEGATGYSPPKEEPIPHWQNPHEEEHEDEMHEVRKRRLEKFMQEKSEDKKEIIHEAQD